MLIASMQGKLDNLKRAAQVHVQTSLLGFAVQRGCAVNDRIGCLHQSAVIVVWETELPTGKVATEDVNAHVQVVVETREVQMQLQCVPETHFGFVRVLRPN